MIDHEAAMLAYAQLAEVSQRKNQLLGRDKLLVLTGAAACRAGWPDVAARCRQLVLEHNHAHLLRNFSTFADALRSEDFAPLLKQLERLCNYEQAEFLVSDLDLSTPSSEVDEKGAGQIALDLLSSSPRANEG